MISRADFDKMSPEQQDSYFREYVRENPGGRYRPNLAVQLPPANQGTVDPTPAPSVDIDVSGLGTLANFASRHGLIDPTMAGVASNISRGATPEQLGTSMAQSGVGYAVNKGLDIAGLSALAPVASSLTSTSMTKDPNYGKAALQSGLQTAAGVAGSVFGPLGTMGATSLMGYLTSGSWEHGFLGDITDSRRREKDLDVVEDAGLSRKESAELSKYDSFQDRMDRFQASKEFGAPTHIGPGETPGIGSMSFGVEASNPGYNLGVGLTSAASNVNTMGSRIENAYTPTSLSSFLKRDTLQRMEEAKSMAVPASFDLSTTAGAVGYMKEHGLRVTDLDTAMSEATAHAGMASIGTGVELTEREKREYGSFEVDKGETEPGGWEEGSAEAGGFEGKGGV